MKHLRKYNESKGDDFKKESEDLLSYYIDEHKAKVRCITNSESISIFISTSHLLDRRVRGNIRFSTIETVNSGRRKGEVVDAISFELISDIENIDDNFVFWEIHFKIKD